jgi:hypothetical protein
MEGEHMDQPTKEATASGSPMSNLAILIGFALVVVGVVATIGSGSESFTSMIPAVVGAVFLVIGVVARRADGLRRHLLHAAAAMSILLVLSGIGTLIARSPSGWALASQIATTVLAGVFAVAAVRSMLAARQARKAGEPAAG